MFGKILGKFLFFFWKILRKARTGKILKNLRENSRKITSGQILGKSSENSVKTLKTFHPELSFPISHEHFVNRLSSFRARHP